MSVSAATENWLDYFLRQNIDIQWNDESRPHFSLKPYYCSRECPFSRKICNGHTFVILCRHTPVRVLWCRDGCVVLLTKEAKLSHCSAHKAGNTRWKAAGKSVSSVGTRYWPQSSEIICSFYWIITLMGLFKGHFNSLLVSADIHWKALGIPPSCSIFDLHIS